MMLAKSVLFWICTLLGSNKAAAKLDSIFERDLPVAAGSASSPDAATPITPAIMKLVIANLITLVLHADILILVLFGCCVVVSIPRMFGRLSSGCLQGHILYAISEKMKTRKIYSSPPSINASTEKDACMRSEDSHTFQVHAPIQRQNSDGSFTIPHHVPAFSSSIHPLSSPFLYRVAPRFSSGQALVLGIYGTILVAVSLLKSNPLTDPVRSGFVAMSQIPFVFALAAKNNLFGFFLGLGYEKINYVHRFVGRFITFIVSVHAIGFMYKWSLAGEFVAKATQPNILCGFGALLSLRIMTFTSTESMRRFSYRLFFVTHVIGFSIMLPAVCFHQPIITPFAFAAAGVYGLDHLVRLAKSRVYTAQIRPLPELSTTRVEIRKLNAGWRAGQHVRLRVLSTRMGLFGWAESHPFTIASVAKTDEGLVLLCKRTGKWTNKLYEMATDRGYGDEGKVTGGNVKVTIEGPYSGPGLSVFESYSAAVFVCGGSGISFGLAALQDLVQKDLEGSSRVKVVELIWAIQDLGSLVPLIPLFTSIVQQNTFTAISISVFYTRATSGIGIVEYALPGLSLIPGRPKVSEILESVVSRTISLGSDAKLSETSSGIIIDSCAPVGLADKVSRAVRQIDNKRRKAVGGVEIHQDAFGW